MSIDRGMDEEGGTCIQWNITQPQKKSKITPSAATWMDLDILTLSEVSQRKKYHLILFTCGL